jgi:hypothetical protein
MGATPSAGPRASPRDSPNPGDPESLGLPDPREI